VISEAPSPVTGAEEIRSQGDRSNHGEFITLNLIDKRYDGCDPFRIIDLFRQLTGGVAPLNRWLIAVKPTA